MPSKKQHHPDMNLNELDYSITYQICHNFDIDRSWELLAAAIGYSTCDIQTFELEIQRASGSPTKKLLWDWGTRGGTVRNLYDKLALINKIQSMRLLEHIVNPERGKEKPKQCKVDNSLPTGDSLSTKSDNYSSLDNFDHNFYDTGSLPIPSMKKPVVKETNTENVNLNMPDMKIDKKGNKPPMVDKLLGAVLDPHGAASVEMFAHADGPASIKGNLGEASSAARSFERLRSVIDECGSGAMNMSGWSESERQIAQALLGTPNYTYKDLSIATNGFSVKNRLGQGKYGEVYFGIVKNTKCAIKKLTQKRERMVDENSAFHMASELKALSKYRHENIVSLYGYTLDEDEVCLVYQYMTNGSLYQCLHYKPAMVLTWEQRLAILRGAACGLQFLHTVDKKPIIHGDIKSSNILLDRHLEAKIGDLGLAKQATGGDVTGKLTHITKKTTSIHDYRHKAYHAPEIARGNVFSVKGDSYSFGVVMFECLSGKQAYDERREGSIEQKYLVEYIQSALEDSPKLNKQKSFQDPKLKISFPTSTFEVLFQIAQKCTENKKKDRPAMVEVYAEIDKCENDHDGPEYKNIQEVVSDKGKKMEAASIHEHHMCVRNLPSYSPGLKSPPGVNPNKTLPESPIDMLPKDQPLPEAFKLQVEIDQRQIKAAQGHDYINVDQVTEKLRTSYLSDPKKLDKIEKFDKENLPESSGLGKEIPASQFRHGQPLENSESLSDSEKSSLKDDCFPYELASDPRKLELLQEQEKSRKELSQLALANHEYQNVPNASEESHNIEAVGETHGIELDKGIDFTREFDEITDKASKKGCGSMMEIFDKFHECVVEEQLTNVVDVFDDTDEFNIQFDFEEDSESSTITESINNDMDLTSADFTDDALFMSESNTPYANTQEKMTNENFDASLEEHQRKLAVYQGMTRNDSEELLERSAQQEDAKQFGKSLPSQGHCQLSQENTVGNSMPAYTDDLYQNCSAKVKGQGHSSSQEQASGKGGNSSPVYGNVNSEERVNSRRTVSIQEFLQSRQPSEGHCAEYV